MKRFRYMTGVRFRREREMNMRRSTWYYTHFVWSLL